MTALRHALCGDDFHQTPVSIVFSEKRSNFFSGFVGDATQVNNDTLRAPPGSMENLTCASINYNRVFAKIRF